MTFEELKALIDRYQGEAGTATGGNVDALVYSGLDVHNMLNEISDKLESVEETYTPKIKMTSYQLHLLENCKGAKMEFRDVLKSPTYNNIRLEMLAIAWLHPELIEVFE